MGIHKSLIIKRCNFIRSSYSIIHINSGCAISCIMLSCCFFVILFRYVNILLFCHYSTTIVFIYSSTNQSSETLLLSFIIFKQADAVDQKARFEKDCHKPCEKQHNEYEKCKVRIQGNTEGLNCEPWKFDYWKCVDKCAAPKIFATLK